MAYYALIMAGGTGTRLWPLSRRATPKQSLCLVGERTMFQHAVDRVLPLFGAEHILVVAPGPYVETLIEQAPMLRPGNFIVEPEGRGTAPCIGLAAVHLRHRDPGARMAVLTADQYIHDVARFRQALVAAGELAGSGYIVTLGIKPSAPVTGYGYIEQGEYLEAPQGFAAYRAVRFTEKPDQETAERMVASGTFSWNSGMFIWRVADVMEEFARQMPDLLAHLLEIEGAIDTAVYGETLARVWPQVPKQTIDYGIMEGARRVAVIPVDIGWSDVGSWASLAELWPSDADGNIVVSDHIGLGTHNSIVFGSKRLVATIGLRDVVIVDTPDALLVCARGREQDVREVVRLLESQGRQEVL